MDAPSLERATDLLVAAIALASGRATAAEVADCAAEIAIASSRGKIATLGQLLIRRHLLKADEYIEIARKLEEPLFACPGCGARTSAKALDAGLPPGSERRGAAPVSCPGCRAPLDLRALAAALPASALLLGGKRPPRPGSARWAPVAGASPARIFGRYEILRVLGTGAMGVVYKARHLDLDRIVALKILREGEGASDAQVRRFLAEARAAARLQHPNIVAIHEIGIESGVHYFTMDFVEGETLQERFRRRDAFAPADAARLIATLASAVHYAHQRGVIHRDLKPANILLDAATGEPKVTDFGLAKQAGADLEMTRSGVAIGTPLYMSPEQARGDLAAVDGRSDVFSLGTIFYQLLTGELPFTGASQVEIYDKIQNEDPVPPRRIDPRIPWDLETICLKALEKRRTDRYVSGKALADDIGRALRGEPIRAARLGAWRRTGRVLKRHRGLATASLAVVLAAGAAWYTAGEIVARRQADAEARARARAASEAAALLGAARAALAEGEPRQAWERAAVLISRFPEGDEAAEACAIAGAARLAAGETEAAFEAFGEAYRRARGAERRAAALDALAAAFLAGGDRGRAAACLRLRIARFPEGDGARRAGLRLAMVLLELDGADLREREGLLDEAAAAPSLAEAERRHARAALAWARALGAPADVPGGGADVPGAIGDLDGDGRPELILRRGDALVGYAARASGAPLAGDGAPESGGLLEPVYRLAACASREEATAIATGDLDADGRAEAVLAYVDREIGAALRVLAPGLPPPEAGAPLVATAAEPAPDLPGAAAAPALGARLALPGRVVPGALAVADLDGDGRAEVVACLERVGAPLPGAAPVAGVPANVLVLRTNPAGRLEPLAQGADDAGRATGSALWCGDLEGGAASVVLGTVGPLGDDLRIYRWSAPAGLSLEQRVKVGPAAAVLADDLDRDRIPEIALATGAGAGAAGADSPGGVHIFRRAAAGASYERTAFDAPGGEALALATGDFTASGAPAVFAIANDEIEVAGGFGLDGGPWRRRLALGARTPEWVRCADLDADGDAELVAGSRTFVRVFGLAGSGALARGGAAAPGAAAPAPRSKPALAGAADPALEIAEDLLDLGLAQPARDALERALARADESGRRDDARRALQGIARAALLAGDRARALDAWNEVARRWPDEEKTTLLLRLDEACARWDWPGSTALLDALEARADLLPAERETLVRVRALVSAHISRAESFAAAFDRPLAAPWVVPDPTRVRWRQARGDVEVHLGARAVPGSPPPPFAPPALAVRAPWGGRTLALTVDWKAIEIEPGAVARLGLLALDGTDWLALELHGARAPGARRHPVAIAASLAGERIERCPGAPVRPPRRAPDRAEAGAGFALDVWYRARIEWSAEPPAVRVSLAPRDAQDDPARALIEATVALPRGLEPGTYLFGAIAPPDLPEGPPVALFVGDLRIHTTPGASPLAARESAPAGGSAAADLFEGHAALASGRPAQAAAAYRRASAAAPFLDEARFAEGLAERENGDLLAAARAFGACARRIAAARDAFCRAAPELAASDRPLEALPLLEAYLASVDPDDAAVRAARDEARRRAVAALDEEPLLATGAEDETAPRAAARRVERARAYLAAGAPEKALAEAIAAVRAGGGAPAQVAAGDAHAALGQASLAAVAYARAVEADPASAGAHLGAARLFFAAGTGAGGGKAALEAAEAAASRALAVGPDDPEALLVRARARLARGILAAARADAERAARIAPGRAEAHALLARIALAEGRRDDARAALARAASLGPVDTDLVRAVAPPAGR